MMPNFLVLDMPVRSREDWDYPPSIPITDLTLEEAVEYGELMKRAFVIHWQEKMKKNKL